MIASSFLMSLVLMMDPGIVSKVGPSAAAVGCAGNPDISDQWLWVHYNRVSCDDTLSVLNYTIQGPEEFSDTDSRSMSWSSSGTPTQGGRTEFGLTPDEVCGLEFLQNGTQVTRQTTLSSVMEDLNPGLRWGTRFRRTVNSGGSRVIGELGTSGNNMVRMRQQLNTDFEFEITDAASTSRIVSTIGDTSSCCGGSGCDGNINLDQTYTIEIIAAPNVQTLIIDGCTLDTSSTLSSVAFTWPAATSTERIQRWGSSTAAASGQGGFIVDLSAVTSNVNLDYHDVWSGGDGTYEDGNECFNCSDGASGQQCDDRD